MVASKTTTAASYFRLSACVWVCAGAGHGFLTRFRRVVECSDYKMLFVNHEGPIAIWGAFSSFHSISGNQFPFLLSLCSRGRR